MTRVVSAIILSGLAFSGLAACTKATPAPDLKAEADAIKAVEDGIRTGYKAKDPAKIAFAYASDATVYTPGARPRVGTAAITAGAKADLADPAFNLAFTTAKVKVSASGTTGYTQGSFSINYTDPKTKKPTTVQGYYLTVFEKQEGGSWKAVEDMATPGT